MALAFAGLAVGYVVGDFDRALRLIDRARDLNPNLATAWYASGTMRAFRGGEPDVAIDHLTRAMRLSPFDPLTFAMQGMMALAHICAGRYEEAADWAEKSCLERPNVAALLRGAAVATRWRDASRRPNGRSPACSRSIPACACATCATGSGASGGRRTSRGMKKDCAGRGWRSDGVKGADASPGRSAARGL